MPSPSPGKGRGDSGSALTRALRLEVTGRRYYAAAAAKCADPFAKAVFEFLVRMEEGHIRDIREIAKRLAEEGKFPAVSTAPHDARMRMFKRETSRLRKELTVSGDAASAMRKALGMEAQGREMYLRVSKGASHPQEKKFFRLLAAEEDTHFAIIYEYLDCLEEQGLRMRE
ncbi:MAG: ferritin family protein [Gemmatimonadota bacterium]